VALERTAAVRFPAERGMLPLAATSKLDPNHGALCADEWPTIGAPIIFGRCPSLSAHESESMQRTYRVCR
jgi:hypothetical protein